MQRVYGILIFNNKILAAAGGAPGGPGGMPGAGFPGANFPGA
jgi:hypothetical protein